MIAQQVITLLLIGYLIYLIDSKRNYFPVPVILVLIGIGLSYITFFDSVFISKDMIFEVFLPALLFTSAYQFKYKDLKDNIGIITILSTVGLILTAILMGYGTFWISELFNPLSLTASFLLASILIPTDPVSVTAILKRSKGEKRIADVVEGESMVNDGTSVVIFTIFLSMFSTGERFSTLSFLTDFLIVSAGGIVIGFIFGFLLKKLIIVSFKKHELVMLTIVIAYGAFYLADAFEVSGVLATVTAGIMLSHELGTKKNYETVKHHLDGFWDIVIPMLLSLLFLLIGIEATSYLSVSLWTFAVLLFLLSIVTRFIVVGGLVYSVPVWRKEFKDDLTATSLLTWSGIKGTMSIALVLWLEAEKIAGSSEMISLAFAVILLSLILQSIGVYPLTTYLTNKHDK
ncbi:sodium:proton antiporter [Exiguobacterium sp. s183]|uniref:cation:proton antiporter n=1 Tax=Exiguobacterium sp. s183 TaxID=2751262 RepID=UPI001BE85196|nr:sodium:proton antiporter [Exiguobacterium sp. s183]